MNDAIKIEVLADGTIRTTTDAVSGPNHANADQFMAFLATLAGGQVTAFKRPEAVAHAKAHALGLAHHHDH